MTCQKKPLCRLPAAALDVTIFVSTATRLGAAVLRFPLSGATPNEENIGLLMEKAKEYIRV
jgi:hypothetical protein